MILSRARHIVDWISLGVGHRGRVLDIGSGNSPHPRADVLCDRYLEATGHRKGPIQIDRRLVCGDVRSLPFATKAFSFAICRMLMEHVDARDVPACLDEFSRVAEGGYIETPSPICELLMPDSCHLNFVELQDGVLVFTPKLDAAPYPAIGRELLRWRKKSPEWHQFLLSSPHLLSIKLRWKGAIRYEIREPAACPRSLLTSAEEVAAECASLSRMSGVDGGLRRVVKSGLRLFFRMTGTALM